MQLNKWPHSSSSLSRISLPSDLLWKRIEPKKLLFIGTNKSIALAVLCSVKYFVPQISPIFQIRLAENREEEEKEELSQSQRVMWLMQTQKQANAKRFVFQTNVKRTGMIYDL